MSDQRRGTMHATETNVKIGPRGRGRGIPRKHRRAVHDRRVGGRRALLARRAPDVAALARRAAPPSHARGRVQLRPRGRRRALGDAVVEAGPGDLVFKPRNQWHTFWNAGDEPCRILEIISPAGFERFFEELVGMGAWPKRTRRRSRSSTSATASRCSRRPSPTCSSASGCRSASRSGGWP